MITSDLKGDKAAAADYASRILVVMAHGSDYAFDDAAKEAYRQEGGAVLEAGEAMARAALEALHELL